VVVFLQFGYPAACRPGTGRGFQSGQKTKESEMMYWVWIILIGILAGWLAGQIMKGRGFGLLGDLIVGIIGSLLGGFLFGLLGLYTYGLIGRLVMAVVGALVLLFLIRFIRHA